MGGGQGSETKDLGTIVWHDVGGHSLQRNALFRGTTARASDSSTRTYCPGSSRTCCPVRGTPLQCVQKMPKCFCTMQCVVQWFLNLPFTSINDKLAPPTPCTKHPAQHKYTCTKYTLHPYTLHTIHPAQHTAPLGTCSLGTLTCAQHLLKTLARNTCSKAIAPCLLLFFRERKAPFLLIPPPHRNKSVTITPPPPYFPLIALFGW